MSACFSAWLAVHMSCVAGAVMDTLGVSKQAPFLTAPFLTAVFLHRHAPLACSSGMLPALHH